MHRATWAPDFLRALAADNRLGAIGTSAPERFNVFEAMGEVRREVRHSNFLAFLLDPNDSHRLEDGVLSRLIRHVQPSCDVPTIGASSYLSGASSWSVHRELPVVDPTTGENGRIDILLLDHMGQRAVIIENKIDAQEGGRQLALYWADIERRYPDWGVYGIYLTPRGKNPSDCRFVRLSYRQLCTMIDAAVANCTDVPQDVRRALDQYVDMVRRHIVDQSSIDQECQRVYRDHGPALEKVLERVHNMQERIGDELRARAETTRLASDERLTLGKPGSWQDIPIISFAPKTWWDIATLSRSSAKSYGTGLILEFQIFNKPQGVDLYLKICPGDAIPRRQLFDLTHEHQGPENLLVALDPLGPGWVRIYEQELIGIDRYMEGDPDGIVQGIRDQWDSFVARDLPSIHDAIMRWSRRVA